MGTRQIIQRLNNLTRRGAFLLFVAMFLASFTASSVAGALPTPTTGDITGTVTNQNGVGLPDIKVSAYSPNSDMSYTNADAWTASDGTYDLSDLPPGDYIVEFNNQPTIAEAGAYYATQWYHNQPNQGTPELVAVTADAVTPNIDDALAAAGEITGKIVDTNGTALAGVRVDAQAIPFNETFLNWATWTRDDGTYNVNVPAGNYDVLFNSMPVNASDPGAYYTHQYYNNKPTSSRATADVVAVSVNVATPNIDATLSPAGAIAGRVADENGNGISNIKITGFASLSDYDNPGDPLDAAFVFTDQNGNYFMGGLPAGSGYIVDFDGPGTDPYHLEEFYDNQQYPNTANAVTVSNNVTTPNINAVLPTLGAISGKVTDTTGAPAQADVSVYATQADFYNNTPTASTTVNADGSYELGQLPAGTYYLYFGPRPGYFYVPQFYGNQPTIGTASTITVVKGVTTPDFNATLAVLSPTTGMLEAHTNKLVPACMGPEGDRLPGTCEALFAGQSVTASASVNVHTKNQGPTGGVTFTFNAASHTLRLVSKDVTQFYTFGAHNESAGLQGTALLTVDGATTTNHFSIIATDGKLSNPKTADRFGIYIWAEGADPATTPPQYFMNKPLPSGNVVIK